MYHRSYKKQRTYHVRLNRALHYIDTHIDQELSLDVISRAAGFSQYHFHRIFRGIVGETLNDYVRRIRLEKAAIILVHNPFRSITEVALDCGFSSSSNFARVFKEHFGMSASQWREGGHEKHRISKIRQRQSKFSKRASKKGEDSHLDAGYDSGVKYLTVKEHEMRVEVKQMPEMQIAYVRHMKGYWDSGLVEAWKKVCTWAGARGLIGPNTKFIGISHDDPDVTPADKCRYDACVTVPRGTKGSGEVNITTLPGGKYAVYHFEGQPQEIKAAYNFMYGKWMPKSGYQPVDSPCYEIYLNDPNKDPEGKHIFDMGVPVKPL
jgi:AraC family transcriptional regulator